MDCIYTTETREQQAALRREAGQEPTVRLVKPLADDGEEEHHQEEVEGIQHPSQESRRDGLAVIARSGCQEAFPEIRFTAADAPSFQLPFSLPVVSRSPYTRNTATVTLSLHKRSSASCNICEQASGGSVDAAIAPISGSVRLS